MLFLLSSIDVLLPSLLFLLLFAQYTFLSAYCGLSLVDVTVRVLCGLDIYHAKRARVSTIIYIKKTQRDAQLI